MAVYNSLISRSEAAPLIPEDVSREIIQGIPQQSAVMQLARRLPNMSRKQQRMPVLASLIQAYFVNPSDTGHKQTSEMEWANKYLNAEELAVIVPIPEAVLADSDYDIWGEIRPRIVEAFGKAFDQAVLFGTNAPSTWPDDLTTGATAAGNTVTSGSGVDIYEDIMGIDGVIAKVEEDGYMVNGHVADLSLRARLRALRDLQNQPIFVRTMQAATQYELDGSPVIFPMNGSMDRDQVLMFSGDWNQLVYTMRQDITYKLLDQAVLTNAEGAIQINLPQQDMVALRAVMRLAWQLPNPINAVQPTEADRYPFALLLPAGI